MRRATFSTSGDLFIVRANFGRERIRASYRVPLVKLYLFDLVSDISPVVVGFREKSQGKRNSRERISNLERELQISPQLASDGYSLGAARGNLGYPTNRCIVSGFGAAVVLFIYLFVEIEHNCKGIKYERVYTQKGNPVR